MNVNKKHKDSVFTLLFSDPDVLRELYCALEGVSLPVDVPVNINTLSDAVFMDRINDISFEIGGKLVVLIEHQSTINPNVAFRLLEYVTRVYEKITGDENLYSRKRIALPLPEFFVLYNGVDPYPDEAVIRLSESFESTVSLGMPEKDKVALELEVKVLNINEGKNEAIAKRCKPLAQYSAFIAKVREYLKEGVSLEEAVKKAVFYCRDCDILKEFLEQNATEVLNMLFTEWNWDKAKEVWTREAREEGRYEEREKNARNALREDIPLGTIQRITGLDMDAIERIRKGM